MNCRNHPTRAAVNTCSQCGDWLCEECTADVGGRIYCASCLQKYWAHDHDAPPKAPPYCPPHTERPREVSFGLLLFFSLILPPGVNYMFEGLIKRGLFMLSSFFLTSYLAGALHEPIFGLIIPIMWITCAFDAFRIRRRLIAGEHVPDSVDDILGFIKKYKTVILLLFVVVLGLHLLSFISGAIVSMPYMLRRIHSLVNIKLIVSVLIVLGGIYFIILSGKRSGAAPKDDGHDKPENK